MIIVINGEERDVQPGATLATVVADTVPEGRGIAVAVDDEVVSRPQWADVALRDGARVEILTAMQGG